MFNVGDIVSARVPERVNQPGAVRMEFKEINAIVVAIEDNVANPGGPPMYVCLDSNGIKYKTAAVSEVGGISMNEMQELKNQVYDNTGKGGKSIKPRRDIWHSPE